MWVRVRVKVCWVRVDRTHCEEAYRRDHHAMVVRTAKHLAVRCRGAGHGGIVLDRVREGTRQVSHILARHVAPEGPLVRADRGLRPTVPMVEAVYGSHSLWVSRVVHDADDLDLGEIRECMSYADCAHVVDLHHSQRTGPMSALGIEHALNTRMEHAHGTHTCCMQWEIWAGTV